MTQPLFNVHVPLVHWSRGRGGGGGAAAKKKAPCVHPRAAGVAWEALHGRTDNVLQVLPGFGGSLQSLDRFGRQTLPFHSGQGCPANAPPPPPRPPTSGERGIHTPRERGR